jgi:hypothetical protein
MIILMRAGVTRIDGGYPNWIHKGAIRVGAEAAAEPLVSGLIDNQEIASAIGWKMDGAALLADLRRAEAHIANSQARIAQQQEIIAELDREGHDTVPAKDMLASFEKTLAKHIANRDRIAGKLAALDLLAMPSDTEPLACDWSAF